jgi:anti-sigma factor RsiW
MNICRQLVELLLEFVADELPPEQRALLERHLEHCPPCQVYLESYQITIRLSRQLPSEGLPPGLAARLRAALDEACRDLKRDEKK